MLLSLKYVQIFIHSKIFKMISIVNLLETYETCSSEINFPIFELRTNIYFDKNPFPNYYDLISLCVSMDILVVCGSLHDVLS